MGMLHDEFFMKRIGGLKRQVQRGRSKRSLDGRPPAEELAACREEIRARSRRSSRLMREEIRPALAAAGIPILDCSDLAAEQREHLREHFRAVLPILTPLAVDAEHPFPFISSQGLNLAIHAAGDDGRARALRAAQGAQQPAALGAACPTAPASCRSSR